MFSLSENDVKHKGVLFGQFSSIQYNFNFELNLHLLQYVCLMYLYYSKFPQRMTKCVFFGKWPIMKCMEKHVYYYIIYYYVIAVIFDRKW